ncbi:MAG: sigma-54 dependent transcriptional regulator [Bdellovibrionales bacterium]|nr:sigma-54 dependent transcriptional regulator [Bdellovibrionales bacterium]
MIEKTRILIVDDEPAICEVLGASLNDEGFSVKVADSGRLGLQKVEEFKPDIILLDIWMPGDLDGLETLKLIKKINNPPQVIIMSGHGNIETAVRAVKMGAWDFVEKPLSMDRISILIQNILQFKSEQREKNFLLNKLRKNIALIGEGPCMRNLKQLISRVASAQSWVLVSGASGTGKGLVAQNLHYLSDRASRPFVEVNCSSIPEELMESELFGFEKGFFVGSERVKKGKFEIADGGTLFLDEISDLSLDLQFKLLKVLQDQSFKRLGGVDKLTMDVRVIATTQKNLTELVSKSQFSEELYYRLNVVPFQIPPLCERLEDVPLLVSFFGEQFARESGYRIKVFSAASLQKMQNYSWPGNVRELRNFVERVYILTPSEFVDVHDLKFAGMTDEDPIPDMEMVNFREARARFEKDFLMKKISENQGNISKTAENIGLERSYLHRKIKNYGIEF